MEVVSRVPFAVGSLLWQPAPGAWILTLICKATFSLQQGEAQVAGTQEQIHHEDLYWDDDRSRSLYAPSDIVPFKPRVDVMLVGSAFAPEGKPVRSLMARLIVGDIDKILEAVPDRSFTQDGALIEGPRFSRMPLVYERAGGGPDSWNPVGVRADTRDIYGRIKVPNLQPPGFSVAAPGDIVPAVGFGPIAPDWPTRRDRRGRNAKAWSPADLRSAPLSQEIDPGFFNAAPPDQQLPSLSEDARILLEHLHPQASRLATNLPGVRPRVTLDARGGMHPVLLRCDTLWIDTDRAICTLTWNGQIKLERPDEPGRILVTLDVPSSPGAARAAPPSESKRQRAMTLVQDLVAEEDTDPGSYDHRRGMPAARQAPTLPFLGQGSASAQREPERGAPAHTGLPFVQPPAAPAPAGPTSQGPPSGVFSAWTSASSTAPLGPGGVPQALPHQPVAPAPAWIQPPPGMQSPPPGMQSPPPGMPSSPPGMQPPPPPPSGPPWSAQPPAIAPSSPPSPPAPPLVPPTAQRPGADSLWAPGVGRPDQPPGRSIGESAVAAAGVSQAAAVDAASGVYAVSSAAAGAGAPVVPARRPDEQAPAATLGAALRPAPRLDNDVLHLVGYDPAGVARICRVPVWKAILDDMEKEPAEAQFDDPAPTDDPAESEDRRDISEILSRGASQDVDQLGTELSRAVRPSGRFVAPLLLLAGDIAFPFDERETLKAVIAVATPLAGADEGLKAAIKDAKEILAAQDQLAPSNMFESFTTRIREAFQKGRRSAGPDALDLQAERALLEGRHYQRRKVLGMTAVRALLHTAAGGGARPAPVYLSEDLAGKLPLYQRFRARLIAELTMQEDQYEAHPAALKALALGRIMPPPDRR